MIWQLLKQLPGALGRYVNYRIHLLMHREPRIASSAQTSPDAPVMQPPINPAPLGPALSTHEDGGLAPAFSELVPWTNYQDTHVLPDALRSLPLFQIWSQIAGGTKWVQYFAAYERVFAAMRREPLRVLEIGVFNGASLRMWRKYFDHPQSVVVGIDIDEKCAAHADTANAVHVMIGDQTDASFLDEVVRRYGPFDIIIDDGSHFTSHVIFSFNHLFQHGLKQVGVYLVEDLHTSYWLNYRDSELSFIDVAKQMVDLMHSHYAQASTLHAYQTLLDNCHDVVATPRLTTMIDEIRFFDSIVAINKFPRPFVPKAMVTDKLDD